MTQQSHEIGQLLSMLRTDDPPVGPEVKKHVVAGLRKENAAMVSEALSQGLQDAEPEYRCTIASVFLAFDFAGAIQWIRPLLQDEDDGVRGFLCQELGAYHRREAVPLLIEALQSDPDGINRVWAAWALGNIGDPSAIPALRLAMQNDLGTDCEGRPVKDIAAEAIRRITQGTTLKSAS